MCSHGRARHTSINPYHEGSFDSNTSSGSSLGLASRGAHAMAHLQFRPQMHGGFLPAGHPADGLGGGPRRALSISPVLDAGAAGEYEEVGDETPASAYPGQRRPSSGSIGTVGSHHTYEGLAEAGGARALGGPLYESADVPPAARGQPREALDDSAASGSRHLDSALSSDAEEALRYREGDVDGIGANAPAAGFGFYSPFGDRSLRDPGLAGPDHVDPPAAQEEEEVRRGDTLALREDGGWAASFIERFM